MEAATAGAPLATSRRPDPLIALTVLAVASLALWPVELESAFGLPAHPLLIHLPVIAVPLLGLSLLAAAVKPSLLDRYGTPLALLAVVAFSSTLLAVGAGEAFRESGEGGPGIAAHADAAETLRLVMVATTAAVFAALWARRSKATAIARVVFVIAAVAATFFVIRTGHLGAEATWGDKGGPPAGMPGS